MVENRVVWCRAGGVGSEVCMAGVGFYGDSGWSSDGSIRWS